MPVPSRRPAIACCVAFEIRSATFVVATEQLAGCRGMPVTHPSRSRIRTRLDEPPFFGIAGSRLLKTPVRAAARAVDSVMFSPDGRLSRLSRRSTSTTPSPEKTRTVERTGMPPFGVPGNASWVETALEAASGSASIAVPINRSE